MSRSTPAHSIIPDNESNNSTGSSPSENSDALIAKELNDMSICDREQVFFDLHGVTPPIAETPDLIARSLTELDDKISKIAIKPAYALTETQNKDYVHNRDFRLMFLRAERFDSELAANRLVNFFEYKLWLFGPEKLGSDISMEDLGPEALACLESGMNTLLPLRDRAGRGVHCMTTRLRGKASDISVVSKG